MKLLKFVLLSGMVLSLVLSCSQQQGEGTPPGLTGDNSSSQKQIIETDRAPEAIGPYSQGILAGGTLYAAGQIGIDPATGELTGDDLESQTVQTLENLKAVIEAAGMELQDVVSVQVFLTDIDDFSDFNAIYETWFQVDPPARAVVEVSALPMDARVEVMLTAVR